MNGLIQKQFENIQVRIIEKDGEPWFVAADVCKVLSINDGPSAVSRLDNGDVDVTVTTRSDGKAARMSLINESGLYDLIFQSRKPEARRFKKWVTSEVLPEIRKTGSYQVPTDPTELVLMAADRLRSERDARILAERDLAAAKPATDFFESVAAEGSDTYSITDVAKLLGLKVRGFFDTLRLRGDLLLGNKPSAAMVNKGVMCERLITYLDRLGKEKQKPTTRITGEGLTFYEKLKRLGKI